ncbi:hypothetical protein Tco_0402991, partial [Tanacetum coccineum]
SRFDVEFHVAVKEYAIGFKMLLFNPLAFSKKDLSKNLKLIVSNLSLGEDC